MVDMFGNWAALDRDLHPSLHGNVDSLALPKLGDVDDCETASGTYVNGMTLVSHSNLAFTKRESRSILGRNHIGNQQVGRRAIQQDSLAVDMASGRACLWRATCL